MSTMFAAVLIASSGLYGLDERSCEWKPLPVRLDREINVLGVAANMRSVIVEAPRESKRYVLSFEAQKGSIAARWSPSIPASADEVLDAANEHGLVAIRRASRVFVLRRSAKGWAETELPYDGSIASSFRVAFALNGREVCVAFLLRVGVHSFSVDTRVYRLSEKAKVVFRTDGEPEYTSILPKADGWTMGTDNGQFSIVLRGGTYRRIGVSENRPVFVSDGWAGSQPFVGARSGVFDGARLLSARPSPYASPITVLPSGRVLWQITQTEGFYVEDGAEKPFTGGFFLNEKAIDGPRVGTALWLVRP